MNTGCRIDRHRHVGVECDCQNEPAAGDCRAAMLNEPRIVISAGTMAEVIIVAAGRGLTKAMAQLLADTISEVVPVTSDRARATGAAYSKWGKGIHPAGLNFGDCFAYALAREFDCALLYVGNDFARTDIVSAIPSAET